MAVKAVYLYGKIKLELFLIPYIKINPKLTIDLYKNMCIKYLREHIGKNLHDFGLAKEIFSRQQKHNL